MNAMTILDSVFSAMSLVAVVYGVHITIRHFRLERTWSYVERWNSQDFYKPRMAVEQFFSEIAPLPQDEQRSRIKALLESNEDAALERRTHIDTVVNLFTELGAAYRCKAVTKDALMVLGTLVVRIWKLTALYVECKREVTNQPAMYKSFEFIKDVVEQHRTGLDD